MDHNGCDGSQASGPWAIGSGYRFRITAALKIGLRRASKPWGVPLHAKRVGMIFCSFDLHVVYTPGPVNLMGDFLSRWAYPANPALGDVSIHGTVQAAGDVRDMMAPEKEELLSPPPLIWGGCGARCY